MYCICRLEKFSDGKRLTEADVSNLRTAKQIEQLVQDEAEILESLAFSGLYSNAVDFNMDYRDQLTELLPSKGMALSDNVLAKLSFLRTSDSALREEEKSYHFLHLTFQEFFAASHFVRQWISKEPLFCFTINGNDAEIEPDVKPHNFVQKEKYNARYDIFWRFVPGLLQSCRDKEQLLRFLQTLDREPRDLLGPTHQRLLMHCFSELPAKPHLKLLRNEMRVRLKQWTSFEQKLTGKMKLCSEMEFPDDVLVTMMSEEKSGDAKNTILLSLQHRSDFSSCLLKEVASFLGQNVSSNLKKLAICALGKQTSLSEDILQAIVYRLEDSDWDVKQSAIDTLDKQTPLSENILQAIVCRLEHSDQNMRRSAIHTLGKQNSLSEDILQAIVRRLAHSDRDVRQSAIDALGKQTPFSEDILQAITRQLEHSDRDVRWSTINTLGRHTPLSEDILQAIARQLEHSDRYMRRSAIDTLGKQTSLSEDTLQAIARQLDDSDRDVRWFAIGALGKQTALSEDILQAIARRLDDPDWEDSDRDDHD